MSQLGIKSSRIYSSMVLGLWIIENVHVPPSPGDAGSAVGAAQYHYFCHDKNKRIIENDSWFTNISVGKPLLL